ncbi:MAG: patatin-like phospholipase family protein, partial [Acidobacteria bacterium]|nr:patatin-like phospholipase family protein [Acidobacteriota bacterium]
MSDFEHGNNIVFRVLALDGGGIRGIFTASFLTSLEELSGSRLVDNFDLLVGTSTGGIIAVALALGIPAQEILQLYIHQGKEIFGNPHNLGMLFRPKYDNGPLVRALTGLFGERPLNDTLIPVCIPSYELTNSYPRIWKDDHVDELTFGGDQPAWKVALASAAAPIFFPAATVAHGDSHTDGGLFANNPSLVGLVEAVRYFRQPTQSVRILSVGAGERAERITYESGRKLGV